MRMPVTAPCGRCGQWADRDPNRVGNWHKACAAKARAQAVRAEIQRPSRRGYET